MEMKDKIKKVSRLTKVFTTILLSIHVAEVMGDNQGEDMIEVKRIVKKVLAELSKDDPDISIIEETLKEITPILEAYKQRPMPNFKVGGRPYGKA
jgi:hypothetical protein